MMLIYFSDKKINTILSNYIFQMLKSAMGIEYFDISVLLFCFCQRAYINITDTDILKNNNDNTFGGMDVVQSSYIKICSNYLRFLRKIIFLVFVP